MDDYASLKNERPEFFDNPVGAGIEILQDENDIRVARQAAQVRLEHAGLPARWADIGVVFQDQYMRVLRDPVRFPDGALGTYVRILPAAFGNPGVAILPVHDGRIILLRHFRHATRAFHLEIPRGFGEPDATPEDDARRELREEIGAECRVLTHLGGLHPNTGISSERVELFFASIDHYGLVSKTADAIDSISVVAPAELDDLIRTGEITDSFTITAWARANLRNLI